MNKIKFIKENSQVVCLSLNELIEDYVMVSRYLYLHKNTKEIIRLYW